MLGTVTAYNEVTGKGLVDDGKHVYMFDTFSIADEVRVYKGMAVYFELNEVKTYVVYLRISLPLFKWAAAACMVLALCACAGPKGDSGDKGAQGQVGDTGSKGETGSQGEVGQTGPQGNSGIDATPVLAVRFCPSQGATTTSHFPEYGFCLGNVLYGVFEDGFHSWMGQVIPGTYTSTSTGLQCTFTVLANCAVQ